MCYAKPAPRCSTHARKALKEAKANYDTASKNFEAAKAEYDRTKDAAVLAEAQEEKEKASKEVEKAQKYYDRKAEAKKTAYAKYKEAKKDYMLTPEGIKKVRDSGNDELADQLKRQRQSLIDASKSAEVEAPKPLTKVEDYQRPFHRAPVADEDNAPLHDLPSLFGDDVLDYPHYYTSQSHDREMLAQLRKANGNPNAKVKIYRALPAEHSHMNRGDWVALSKQYAETHLKAITEDPNAGEWHIISAEVPASSLWNEGNDLAEFGYDGEMIDTAPRLKKAKASASVKEKAKAPTSAPTAPAKGFREVLKEHERKMANTPPISPARAKVVEARKRHLDLKSRASKLHVKAIEDPQKYASEWRKAKEEAVKAQYAYEDSVGEAERLEA